MPRLVRLYIRHVAIGFALSAVFVAGLLWLDIAGLWRLVSGSTDGILAIFMLVMFNGIVFSGVQFGIAIMGMAAADAGDGGRKATARSISVPARALHDRR